MTLYTLCICVLFAGAVMVIIAVVVVCSAVGRGEA